MSHRHPPNHLSPPFPTLQMGEQRLCPKWEGCRGKMPLTPSSMWSSQPLKQKTQDIGVTAQSDNRPNPSSSTSWPVCLRFSLFKQGRLKEGKNQLTPKGCLLSWLSVYLWSLETHLCFSQIHKTLQNHLLREPTIGQASFSPTWYLC